jgi:short subunit dehydrogenase-like uncharacterized protein
VANFLLYGANGYTGGLIARYAVARGHRPVLAGRDASAVAAIAGPLGLEHRAFALDDAAALAAGLAGARAVLHCAGPFSRTSRPMADACLRTGAHYLDVTGEIGVFEALARRDAEARAAGVMLLPGVGFDVVPSDCLAAHLKRRLPTATHLALGIDTSGGVSRGTATTIIEELGTGGLVRRGGALVRVPDAAKTRAINFGRGVRVGMLIPWGDVSTAYYTTEIPNIEVYVAAPPLLRVAARLARPFGPLLASRRVQGWLKARVRAGKQGPTDEERARGAAYLWGEARDDRGGRAVAWLRGPDGYTFTALAALAVVEGVLAGQAPPGFQTPGRAYGADFVLDLPGVQRRDGP